MVAKAPRVRHFIQAVLKTLDYIANVMIKYKSDDGLENWKGRTMEKARQVKESCCRQLRSRWAAV